MKKPSIPTITYHYRGLIENHKFRWINGYSANSSSGQILYPWKSERECRRDAESQGAKAVFVRKGSDGSC